MKKYYMGLAGLLMVLLIALIAAADSPFPPWIHKLSGDVTINEVGSVQLASGTIAAADLASSSVTGPKIAEATSSEEGTFGLKIARFIYDTATDGGSVAAHGLGVTLPARAVIIRSYFKIITQFTDSGSGTVALHCEDANNIKTATDITGSSANAFVEGASTGAASAFVRGIAADCEITATVATATQDAGKLIGWVEYIMEN